MKLSDITNQILERIRQNGWQAKFVSINHIKDLQEEIETLHQDGLLDQALYDDYLNRFDFDLSAYFDEARSMIIVTAVQPQQRIGFNRQDQTHACIIPPTYSQATDRRIKDGLDDILKPQGFRLEKKRLPEKLLAVRSGLARYGKNNITYVPGMGSFHRPVVFVSDMPCEEDSWGESKSLKACADCSACLEACPTDAIVSNRFLLHAERCITFHNERPPKFPEWLDASWHNCLVGCMFCQHACPMNKKFLNWIDDGATFTQRETDYFLNETAQDNLPREIVEKLEGLDMMEYADVLGRNLKALLKTPH